VPVVVPVRPVPFPVFVEDMECGSVVGCDRAVGCGSASEKGASEKGASEKGSAEAVAKLGVTKGVREMAETTTETAETAETTTETTDTTVTTEASDAEADAEADLRSIEAQLSVLGHRGYLMKEGGWVRSWKKRFFVLKQHAALLCYYPSPESAQPLGTIDLNLYRITVEGALMGCL
jgi:hypothetical protein